MEELHTLFEFEDKNQGIHWFIMGCQGFSYDTEIRNMSCEALKSLKYYARKHKDEIQEMKKGKNDWKFISFALNIYSFLISYFHIEVDLF